MANGKIHSPISFVKTSSSSDSDDNDETALTKLASSSMKRELEEVRKQQLSELALMREENKTKMESLELKKKQIELLPFDDDAAFFHSLLVQASELDPKSKMEFRIKVQQLLYDFSFNKTEDLLLNNKCL